VVKAFMKPPTMPWTCFGPEKKILPDGSDFPLKKIRGHEEILMTAAEIQQSASF
jgi:hypothetical protein